jgi:hypothetical protein
VTAPANEGDRCPPTATNSFWRFVSAGAAKARQESGLAPGSLRSRRASGDPVKTTREKAEEKRAAKLGLVRVEVQSGSLVIRQMTDEERRRYPPRPASPKRPARERGS